jgi:hypothetical protein
LPRAQEPQTISSWSIAKSPKQPDPGHCQKPKTKQLVHHAHGQEPKTSRAHGHCQKPETKQFIILMADIPEQAAHLISSGNGSLAFMAGLNKIMKDDEMVGYTPLNAKMNGFYNFCSKHI